jgi:hypothetical protein
MNERTVLTDGGFYEYPNRQRCEYRLERADRLSECTFST